MCLLLETIKLENGRLNNISYHNQRLNAARAAIFGDNHPIRIEKEISVPPRFRHGTYRCRITCSRTIEKTEFVPLQQRCFNRLKVIHDNEIDYPYKFADRSHLNNLYEQKGNADEIIIIKNGLVTDCSVANLVLYDGAEWHTPDIPLLKGTQRQLLLDRHLIREKRIRESDLIHYQKLGLINAFFDLNDLPEIKIDNIFY